MKMVQGPEKSSMVFSYTGSIKTGVISYQTFLILVLTSLFLYNYWRKRNFYKLAAAIDGPKGFPFIGNALEYFYLDHIKILDYLMELTTKYNGLAKNWVVGSLIVYISKPEDLEIVLSSNKLIEKNFMYSFLRPVLGEGLLNGRGDIWRRHRKIIAPTFHPNLLKYFVRIFSEQSKMLIKALEKSANGKIFDVFPFLRNCALDFISETALEYHLEAQSLSSVPAAKASERIMNIMYGRIYKWWLYPDFIFFNTKEGKEFLKHVEVVKESIDPKIRIMKKRLAEQDRNENVPGTVKRKSFIRQLLELNKNSENFSDAELSDEVKTIIITGYETSAATVGFILVMLGIHQDVQAKVYEEVVAMQELLKGRELEVDDLAHFEYMNRVIKETLRLYPVGPVIFRQCTHDVKLSEFIYILKTCPEKYSTRLASCIIPKGASIGIVTLKTHKDPAIWENPYKFDPDNFLPEKCEKRHPYAYIPFSAGPRNCIGKNYAYLSMRVMLYYILSKYKVLCDLRVEDIKVKSEVTLKMVGGYKIRLLPRGEKN